jgi:uncharacterized protein (TIGR00255 family)
MRSMTGFGEGEATLGACKLVVEVRSLNNRFLDTRVWMPEELESLGFFLEQQARKQLSRGRHQIAVRMEGATAPPPNFDLKRARAAYRALAELRDELAPGTELPITAVTNVPEFFVSPQPMDVEAARAALCQALSSAIEQLDQMRRSEGGGLKAEFMTRIAAARKLLRQIGQDRAEHVRTYQEKLRERVRRLLGDVQVSVEPGRLEAEIAILADKLDVREELVRLDSHLDQFEQLLEHAEPVGRRLDFLLQEMIRELNTLGAKSHDASLSHSIVELKSEVEQIREQIQNVE